MKKYLIFILTFILCFSLCSCGKSTEEKLKDDVVDYIFENYRITKGTQVSNPVNLDIESITEKESNQWVVLGTYTVRLGSDILSAKFGLVATYDESKDEFKYSNQKFDDFK